MNIISLTSSMRNNLLSLQQTAKLQDATQNRLASGKKVNSAIDSPSAYYTAQALNNRAKDLSALMDAMSQGVQTIKAATTALDSGIKFLEQARAAANYAYDEPLVPKQQENIDYNKYSKLDKAWFAAQAGANSAVVETADELKAAIAAGKETIVVYGKINMASNRISLNNNQKLVGTEYFANVNENALYRDGNTRFSELKFDLSTGSPISLYDNAEVSNIKIDLKEEFSYNDAAINAMGATKINNVDINVNVTRPDSPQVSGILINGGNINISGKINITMLGNNPEFGIYALSGKAKIDQADINIDGAGRAMIIGGASTIDISNTIFETTRTESAFLLNSEEQGGNTLNINENVIINSYTDNIFSNNISTNNNPNSGTKENIINIKAQTKIFAHNIAGTEHKAFETSKDSSLKSETESILLDLRNFEDGFSQDSINTIVDYYNFELPSGQKDVYNSILQQYDALIKDSSYKGVNLLQEQNLKVNFNEDRSSQLLIKGHNASLKGLQIDENDWNNKDDIQNSLEQISNALGLLREMSSELGNYYSIVTNREEFTGNLINVLSEGADKLTLADMNEESANMLALQTRQQLAINSLSLASQTNQSILKLF